MTPEHIKKELKLISANILAAQERMDAIVKELAESKSAEVEEWPKVGDDVAVINNRLQIHLEEWDGGEFQQKRLAAGMIYRTREEAEAKSKWLANPRTEARFRLEQLEGFDVKGIFTVINNGERLDICTFAGVYTGGISFTMFEQAEHAKTHHADDLMLVLKGEVQS